MGVFDKQTIIGFTKDIDNEIIEENLETNTENNIN